MTTYGRVLSASGMAHVTATIGSPIYLADCPREHVPLLLAEDIGAFTPIGLGECAKLSERRMS